MAQSNLVKSALALIMVCLVGCVVSAGVVFAQSEEEAEVEPERRWHVTGTGEAVSIADCENCDEDMGMVLACLKKGEAAELTVPWASVETGVVDEKVVVKISVDEGAETEYSGVTELQELLGYLPKISLLPNDPLIKLLATGSEVKVTYAGEETYIDLEGAAEAVKVFVAECGWEKF